MATLYEQRNLSMTPALWQALEALAVQTNSRSTRGPQAHQHSWRTVIERIAAGDFTLVEKEPYQMPPGLDAAIAAIAANEERQREQERLEEQRRRIAEHTKQATKTPVKMQQMNMLPDLEPA